VATACVIRLIPRPEHMVIVDATCAGARRDAALARLQSWYRSGMISTVWKGYNAAAVRSYALHADEPLDPDALQIYGLVSGPKAMVRHAVELLKEEAASAQCFSGWRIHDPTDKSPGLPEVLRIFLSGEAACSAHASFPGGCDIDRDSKEGWVMFLPVLPFTPADLRHGRELVQTVALRHGVAINTTMNFLNDRAVDLVTTLRFQRRTAEVTVAHRVLDELHQVFSEAGYRCYRTDIDHQRPEDLYQDPVYLETLMRLGKVFDPHCILSPGRYTP
jgi:4-cresol dehydrogenase (hydroxylating)